jgi:cell division protein FtsB
MMNYQGWEHFGGQRAARWGVRLLFAVLCMLVGLLGIGFGRMAWREHELNATVAHQLAMNEAQRARNKELEAETAYRESDAYAELAAREQLSMARPGDTVLLPTMVTPPLPQLSDSAPSQDEAAQVAVQPNYLRWWQALFPPTTTQP